MKMRLISLVESSDSQSHPAVAASERYSSVLFGMTTETMNQFELLKQTIQSDARLSQ